MAEHLGGRMKKKHGISRRSFLAGTAAAISAPMILPSRVLGREGHTPPSEKIGIGIVGCGAMNTGHAYRYVEREQTQVVAVCDVNSQKRGDLRSKIQDRYAQRLGLESYDACQEYNDFRDMIADSDVDAICVATPEHWHVLPALHAARVGKHAYIEKPMTLTIEEGRVLADTAKRTGAVIQHGAQQRSHWGFPRAVELVRNGRLGNLKHVEVVLFPGPTGGACQEEEPPDFVDYDLWLGPARWTPYCSIKCIPVRGWTYMRDYSGGRITEWGTHHLDLVQYALDADETGPVEISGSGLITRDAMYNTVARWNIDFRFESGVIVHFADSGYEGEGIKFVGEDGSIFVNRDGIRSDPENLLDSEIGPDEIHIVAEGDHHQNFIHCIKTGEKPRGHVESGHRSSTMCHLANICVELEQTLYWDPKNERFLDNQEADAEISRPMRAPWSLYET